MKKSLALSILTSCIGCTVYAQDSNTMYLKTDTSARMQIQNHYLYRNNHIVQFKNGDSTVLGMPITFNNGNVLDPVGMLTNKKKKSYQLKDGESVDVDGNLVHQNQMPKKKP